jgi:hypothetical protein
MSCFLFRAGEHDYDSLIEYRGNEKPISFLDEVTVGFDEGLGESPLIVSVALSSSHIIAVVRFIDLWMQEDR